MRDGSGARRLRVFVRACRTAAVSAALVGGVLLGPVSAHAAGPHGDYSPSLPAGSSKCSQCHRSHLASTATGLLSIDPTTGVIAQTTLCFKCHGYAGPAQNAAASFDPALPGGHRVEDATGTVPADLTNTCSGCHDPHGSAAGLPRAVTNGQDVSRTVDANSWCWACHDPDLPKNWSGLTGAAYYDRLSQPSSSDASGYPMIGTLRAKTAYQSSAHASIPASSTAGRATGDCLWCHASHRSPNARDGLLAAFGPTAPGDAESDLCLICHGQQAGAYGTGHVIQSTDASLPPGSPVPCYECHNPHGSMRNNTALVSDALGQGLNPKAGSPGYSEQTLSQFCFTCHTTAEGYWWDSVNGVMAPPADIAQAPRRSVAGIDRLAGSLRLPPGPLAHSKDGLSGCACHGPVHAPQATPLSGGGLDCYTCHTVYQDRMEKGGSASTSVYHHVLGTGAGDGDTAFLNGSYPTSITDVYCMSCHADHDQFNAAKGANLRAGLSSTATTASTDYLPSGAYGICVSCHAVSLAKDPGQKSDGLADTDTPRITGGTLPGAYGAGVHNYSVPSTFGDSTTFGANCSKCHNDEQTKQFQQGTRARFGTHFSAVRRLLSAFGGTLVDPLGERHCYGCHSEPGDMAGGKTPAELGRDYYGAASMSAAAEDVYDQFQLGGSTHPVQASPTGSVECESCHNAHSVQSSSPVSEPTNTYNLAGYTTTSQKAQFCLTCHDADGGPARDVSNTTYVPHTVRLTKPKMNKAGFAAGGHWSASGAISAAETVTCGVCHENHGSVYEKLLGARDVATNTNRINGQAITGNDNSVCFACHTVASTGFPIYTRLPNGYPDTATWPGRAVYTNATYGIHRTLDGGLPGSTLPDYAPGDCKTCHDVHGTANQYDELTATFTQANFGLCFVCHDANGPATDNIAQWYPAASGGTASNTTRRYGHKTVEAGTLPAGSALPCYDCHNPHGSGNTYGLQVVTQTGPSTTISVTTFSATPGTPYAPSDALQVRAFCFTCHVPSDTNNGWNGSGYSAITAGATFEGLNRLTQLKLSSRQPHAQADTRSCYQCHNTPHWPE
jgi:predicted CXXCH cytochrome family protein